MFFMIYLFMYVITLFLQKRLKVDKSIPKDPQTILFLVYGSIYNQKIHRDIAINMKTLASNITLAGPRDPA